MTDGADGEVRSFTAADGAARLDVFLAAVCADFSRSRIKGLIEAGRVTVDGAPVTRAGRRLDGGAQVVLHIPPPVPAVPQPEDIPLAVLYEDADVIVIDKPAGLVVHPAPGHVDGTLVNALLHHAPEMAGIGGVMRPGIVHRLDRDTSGVMIVAKTDAAMRVLAKEFAAHGQIRKTYRVVVHGAPAPPEGRIENLIGRCPWDRKRMAVVERNGKRAVTNYRVVRRAGAVSAVECVIETGRTHQIRVHLASRGCPVVGDDLYGRPGWDARLPVPPHRQLLHAWRLELKHPVTREPLAFTAPLPDAFQAAFA